MNSEVTFRVDEAELGMVEYCLNITAAGAEAGAWPLKQSPVLTRGESFAYRFSDAGTFEVVDSDDPEMKCIVEVYEDDEG